MRRELGTLYSDNVTTISVDDMAKILSNALAVSPYLQIKRFFAEGDSPNFDDHDFPVPGYLLFVSGYMFLNLNENTSDSEFNGSNNAIESLNRSQPSFENMVPDDAKIDIFAALSHQVYVQWNLKMSTKYCCDLIKKNISEYLLKDLTPEEFFINLDNAITIDSGWRYSERCRESFSMQDCDVPQERKQLLVSRYWL